MPDHYSTYASDQATPNTPASHQDHIHFKIRLTSLGEGALASQSKYTHIHIISHSKATAFITLHRITLYDYSSVIPASQKTFGLSGHSWPLAHETEATTFYKNQMNTKTNEKTGE